MKKQTYHLLSLFLLDIAFTIGATHMYYTNKGLTTDFLSILLGIVINLLFINEVNQIMKDIYETGRNRGRLEIKNTFKKEN